MRVFETVFVRNKTVIFKVCSLTRSGHYERVDCKQNCATF